MTEQKVFAVNRESLEAAVVNAVVGYFADPTTFGTIVDQAVGQRIAKRAVAALTIHDTEPELCEKESKERNP